jgi:predicted RNA-binding protein with EMAP domain
LRKGIDYPLRNTTLVQPHDVVAVVVGDPCIEIASAIEVTEGDTFATPGAAECLVGTVCKVARSIVDPRVVGVVVVGDPCIEVANVIDVTEGDTAAIGVRKKREEQKRDVSSEGALLLGRTEIMVGCGYR